MVEPILWHSLVRNKDIGSHFKQEICCGLYKSYSVHSWTRTTRLTHDHRLLRLAEDFEMLRLAGTWWASDKMSWNLEPDAWFQNIASGWCLAGVWLASVWRLTPDFNKLHLAGAWQASGAMFWNHTSGAMFQNQASDATFQNLPPDAIYSVTMHQTCIISGIVQWYHKLLCWQWNIHMITSKHIYPDMKYVIWSCICYKVFKIEDEMC